MKSLTKQGLIEAEAKLIELFNRGELPYLLHLSGGNEDQLIEIFERIHPEDYVLGTHRAHYHYLLKGGTVEELVEKVKGGHSMFLFSKERNFLTSSIVAGLTAVAVGLGWAFKAKGEARQVWCFVGDGAEDEGHFYEAVLYAKNHNLPVHFIIEDNGRSVESTKEQRRGDGGVPFGVCWPDNVERYHYTPTYPHAGTGTKTMVKFLPEAVEEAKNQWR
jgi:TPP-dependent pyruvate/acetoin dehydrogenase alpha subunit